MKRFLNFVFIASPHPETASSYSYALLPPPPRLSLPELYGRNFSHCIGMERLGRGVLSVVSFASSERRLFIRVRAVSG